MYNKMSANNGRNAITIPLARHLFASQLLRPSQLAQYCYNIATHTQHRFNAFSCIYPLDEILAAANASDGRHKNGTPKSVLDGIPISIKANIAVKGKPWNACSNILNDVVGFDSVVAKKLKDSGAILIGSTNMDEFGMGSLGINCNTGCTINPIPFMIKHCNKVDDEPVSIEDLVYQIQSLSMPEFNEETILASQQISLSAGGSSSGSAVSVAVGSSLASIGTDTGGSIRLPSAWCGVVGLKPTYGSISRQGVISYASSLDTVGIIANSVQCTGLVFNVLKHDADETAEQSGDATSCCIETNVNFKDEITTDKSIDSKSKSLQGLRIGIPEAFVVSEYPSHILETWENILQLFEANGASTVIIPDNCISHSTVKMSLPAYYVISSAEASSNLARYDGIKVGKSEISSVNDTQEQGIAVTRLKGFGKEVIRRVLAGTAVLSSDRFHSYYEAATRVRAAITTEFHKSFRDISQNEEGVDLILIPTALTDPKCYNSSSLQMIDNTEEFQNDILTTPISLSGLPSISLPILNKKHIDKNQHPVVGIQIIGSKGSDQTVLSTSQLLLNIHMESQ